MWIAAVAALAAAAIKAYDTHQTIKHKNQEAIAGIHAQGKRQDQANGLIATSLKQLQESTAAHQKLARGQTYNAALANAGAQGHQLAGQAGPGVGSKAYQAAAATATAGTQAQAGQLADLYAATDAPLYQRQDEAFRIGDLGTDLGTIGMKARDDANENRLKIAGITNNPWMEFAANALQGYAAASGRGGASTQATIPTDASTGGNWTNAYGASGSSTNTPWWMQGQ